MSIVTRPSVTTDVCTVRPHKVDVESGYTNTTFTGPGGGQSVSYPQSYLRAGSGDPRIEYDITPPSYNTSTVGGATVSGASDTAVGIKDELGYTDRALWGWNAQVSFPTGSTGFTAGHPQYTLNANWGYTLSPALSLSGTVGFDAYAFVPSVDLTSTLSPVDEVFVEYAYFTRAAIGAPPKSIVDGGFIHDFSPHVQVDVEAGVSPALIFGQRQHYVGAGISFMN
jgi:hypothetical protein